MICCVFGCVASKPLPVSDLCGVEAAKLKGKTELLELVFSLRHYGFYGKT